MGGELKREDYLNTLEIEWLEALHSDKYKRCESQLRRKDSYCCLGVLCDVSKIGKWREDNINHDYMFLYTEDKMPKSSFMFIPPILQSKIKADDNVISDLMLMNDKGKSFKDIADFYEDYKKKQFLAKKEN